MVPDSLKCSIAEAGLNPGKVEELLARARREVDAGLLSAAQVALARNGRLAMLATFGDASQESLFCVFSATKAVTSAAAWILIEEGRLHEGEVVADIIPEFASNGKDVIRVGQLLTHTAGLPAAPFRPLDWNDPARRRERYAQWKLNWTPGSRFEYHPSSSMWVIAELIERRAGQSFQSFIRERIAEPLGLEDLHVGLPDSAQGRAVLCEHGGQAMSDRDWRDLGLPPPPATEVTEDAILSFNRPEVRAVGVPGGGAFMSAAELALFYQGLLHGGLRGQQVWSDAMLSDARRVRTGKMADLWGMAANRGLGIIVAGDEKRSFRGFGKTNSPEAFGHNGAGGQLAWADPATGLSLGYCTSTHDRHAIRQGRRGVAISSIAALCAS
ncbi:MAG: serine hydrolase [Gammaproteobacteria bacterium]|nr:serine hydrolase [Gammaproteobacteria bacterium]